MGQEHINQLRSWMVEQGLDAFLITQPQNRSYLSGWLNDDTEGSGSLLIGQEQQILLTNPLYAEVAEREEVGWKTIGFEAADMSYLDYEKLASASEGVYTLKPVEQNFVNRLRQVKSAEEIALLRQAIEITDKTFAYICEWIQPGMTEKQVQWELARKMVELGAEGPAFGSIVASGPNSSMPHAHAGQRPIGRGEMITIDMGARYKGYCADMTRTICLGEPAEPRMREIYDAVLLAMRTCEQGLSARVSGVAGDALARDVLKQAGLAQYYV